MEACLPYLPSVIFLVAVRMLRSSFFTLYVMTIILYGNNTCSQKSFRFLKQNNYRGI